MKNSETRTELFLHSSFCLLHSSKALLPPRIRRVRITAQFPEPQQVAIEENDFAHELGAFPGVTLRDNHPRRTAVLDRQRLAGPLVRDENVIVQAYGQWVVRGITVVALEVNMRRFRLRLHQVSDGEERHAFEFHVELAPGRDAMKVADVLERRQCQEL